MSKVLLLGATSSISQAVAREYAEKGFQLFLVGRNISRLEKIASDLIFRGASQVQTYGFDFLDESHSKKMLETLLSDMKSVDIVLLAYGMCPSQVECEKSSELVFQTLQTNYTSAVQWLLQLAPIFERQKFGSLAVISSVAGDRGRKSNYVYGSSKGALSLFCEGLQNRLYAFGVSVTIIKPGFVDTPMTQEMKKNRWFASPQRVARDIVRAIEKKQSVLYTPWYWRWVMLGIRGIPTWVAQRLSW